MSATSDYESRIDAECRALIIPQMFGFFDKIGPDMNASRTEFNQLQEMGRAMLPAFDGSEEELTISGLKGQPNVEIRVYKQNSCSHPEAVLILAHGGGYVLGDANDNTARRYTPHCTVVSVQYRMAPEHRSPAAAYDMCAAISWVADQSDTRGFDRKKIMVGGNSSGGGLAASAALLNRDLGGPRLAWQLLLYPMLDDQHAGPSGKLSVPNWLWNLSISRRAWAMYAEEIGASPYAAAMRADDLSGLPPAYIMCGDLDIFRDSCIAYANRLMAENIPVELSIYPGGVHGFDVFAPLSKLGARANAQMDAALAQIVGS